MSACLPQLSGIKIICFLRRFKLSSVACPDLQDFSTFSQKRQDFPENVLNIKCINFLYNFFLKHFSIEEEFSEILSQM
jgi:hypothetical protein